MLPVARLIASLVVGLILAAIGGLVLAEYTFQGAGIQWLAISGGAGLGAAMAWVINRVWSHDPPPWMIPVAAVLAMLGEAQAVHGDNPDRAWPPEGWAAIVLAGAAAAYGVYSAGKVAARERAKKNLG
jgi:ABC-type Fe3+-siderophore transport system permease subunit